MKRRGSIRLAVLLLTCAAASAQSSHRPANPPPDYTFVVVNAFHHDPSAFTQGLAWHGGFLYEGTGREGKSSLRKVRLETGDVLQQADLAPDLFGEGIAIVEDPPFKEKIIQLTWTSHTGFVYDLGTFRQLRTFSFPGEGWGLASDGRDLYLSDGSSQIRVLDATTFKEKRRIKVRDGKTAIDQLNELEIVDGQLFANVWHSNRIARISPQTGAVIGWVDLTGLLSSIYRLEPEAVLNGIAYDPAGKRLFVTGKLWPSVFEIRLVPKEHK